MYTTCLFCNGDLGTNEVVEQFPVGRRLAFDGSKGRLWVVCRKCERWNLTPLEERWEAIETCERLFESTRLRASTDNIGLARLKEGLELVRIGSAQRPEFAAWRYGDQFGKRRRRYVAYSAAGIAVVGGLIIGGAATGIVAGSAWTSWQFVNGLYNFVQKRRPRLKLSLPDEPNLVTLRKDHLSHTELARDETEGWILRLSYEPETSVSFKTKYKMKEIRGGLAMRVAGQILPKINVAGAGKDHVQDAVRLIEQYPDPQRLFRGQAKGVPRFRGTDRAMHHARIEKFPTPVRLALEMASHEDQERRALEGELAVLEAAWKQAEEIAKIADDMFLPPETADRLAELKKRDS